LIKGGYLEVTPPSFDFTSSFLRYVSSSEEAKILKSRDFNWKRNFHLALILTLQVVKRIGGAFSVKKGNQKDIFTQGRVVKRTITKKKC
jgi:hypothetical protein